MTTDNTDEKNAKRDWIAVGCLTLRAVLFEFKNMTKEEAITAANGGYFSKYDDGGAEIKNYYIDASTLEPNE